MNKETFKSLFEESIALKNQCIEQGFDSQSNGGRNSFLNN